MENQTPFSSQYRPFVKWEGNEQQLKAANAFADASDAKPGFRGFRCH